MERILKALCLLSAFLVMSSCASPSGSTDAVLQNILHRRSVRQYTPEKLTDGEIGTLLRAGMAAPSGMNIQPWSFVVVTDPAVAEAMVSSRVNTMYTQAPCLIVVCGDTTVVRRPRGAAPDAAPVEMANDLWTADCAAVTENILLAAEALGLGAVWTACYPHKDRYEQVAAVLGLPDKVLPYSVVAVGHPAEDPAPKDKWRPERIHYDRW